MDTVILVAALVSFFALVASWLALPHGSEAPVVVTHGAVVRV